MSGAPTHVQATFTLMYMCSALHREHVACRKVKGNHKNLGCLVSSLQLPCSGTQPSRNARSKATRRRGTGATSRSFLKAYRRHGRHWANTAMRRDKLRQTGNPSVASVSQTPSADSVPCRACLLSTPELITAVSKSACSVAPVACKLWRIGAWSAARCCKARHADQ